MVLTGYEAGWDTVEKGKISTPAENWTAVVDTVASHCTELCNRLDDHPTGWLNLCSKDLPPIVGLSGATLQIWQLDSN